MTNVLWPERPSDWTILSPKDTARKIGVSTTTLERIAADPSRGFPAHVRITERRLGYLEHEVAAWIRDHVAGARS